MNISQKAEILETAEEINEDKLYRKVIWRFMPLIFVCYIVAYLDRVNVGFAKLQMLNDLHLSEAVYGLGAGIFFVGYFIFEVPSNLLLHRVGARKWISRIMVSWGIVSASTAWVTTPEGFYVVRFLLGVAEAGFFPGMILYLTYWFPSYRRARMVAFLMAGNPFSGVIGGPLSGGILYAMQGFGGYAGWQWLYVLEAIPAVILGVVIFFYLDDGIRGARWLSNDEKELLADRVANEAKGKTHTSLGSTFSSPRVWLMCLILFGIIMGSYALGFWQPTVIRESGVTNTFYVGLLSIIPYACALVSMVLTGQHADRHRERRWHVVVPELVAAVGFIVCAMVVGSHNTVVSMIGLTMVAVGIITALPMFWALPTAFLGGTAAAAGIALVNSTGNLAGFVSPMIVGWLKDQTHSLSSGLYLVSGCLVVSAVLILALVPAKLVNR